MGWRKEHRPGQPAVLMMNGLVVDIEEIREG